MKCPKIKKMEKTTLRKDKKREDESFVNYLLLLVTFVELSMIVVNRV